MIRRVVGVLRTLGAMVALVALVAPAFAETIRVGSKAFTESNILAEIAAQVLEKNTTIPVVRKHNLGGSGIIYQSLKFHEIDLYPDYTGTIAEAMLKLPLGARSWEDIQSALNEIGLVVSRPLGFNNTYALAVRKATAQKHQLQRISDLVRTPHLVAAFDLEFTNRKDGAIPMIKTYDLQFSQQLPMEHALVYEAIAHNRADVIDVYSTDPKIASLGLVVLDDDKGFFPSYLAVIMASQKFTQKHPALWRILTTTLESNISEQEIIELNRQVEFDKYTAASVAKGYLGGQEEGVSQYSRYRQDIWGYLYQHLQLVVIPLLGSILVGVLLGILGICYRPLAQLILSGAGILQTIPSLALLCLLIPVVGIGKPAAYWAIFLYGILPITRNTYLGLTSVHQDLIDYAHSIGLNRWELLRFIQLPIAMKSILAGVKTSAIINVGTATLAAFVGGGGLGAIIVAGLTLNDQSLVLLGAVPASLLAMVIHVLCECSDRFLISKGLR